MRFDFALICRRRIFYPQDQFSLEILSFFHQFFHALRVVQFLCGKILYVAGQSALQWVRIFLWDAQHRAPLGIKCAILGA